MEIEKVKEIKKVLECCQGKNPNCVDCSYWCSCKKDYGVKFRSEILTLINELESENERLNECYKVRAFNKLRAENKQLKDRIAEIERLKTQLAQANSGIVNCSGCKLVELNAVKEFAGRLKDKMYENENGYIEFLSGKNAVAVDIVDFENCLDETLKEFIDD